MNLLLIILSNQHFFLVCPNLKYKPYFIFIKKTQNYKVSLMFIAVRNDKLLILSMSLINECTSSP